MKSRSYIQWFVILRSMNPPLNFIRLNGQMGYDEKADLNYYDLYVDDNLPNQFYFGYSNTYEIGDFSSALPAMGGKVTVTEGLPEMNWGKAETLQDAVNRDNSVYTDQHGYYTLTNLTPGIYNVAVFTEDNKFQESTYRPDTNASRVSEVVYIPGFPTLELVTDFKGVGVSSLLWSENSKKISVPSKSLPQISHIFNFNGAGYEIVKLPYAWAEAAEKAASRGKLVEIESAEEQDAIFDAMMSAEIDPDLTLAPDGGGHICGSVAMILQQRETGFGMEIMIRQACRFGMERVPDLLLAVRTKIGEGFLDFSI